ncbi:ATPase family AAA domain-containing protein 1-A [Aphis craccivora]|uniref:ATPase family AAA domain-containing protein 1-A n=1 Tax=Aphis craccivora TaxID=307492 RepID=A0A6G0Y458_APHCR|nr:ATPase family AAA domain-containing protein 1-A [Aphis craccivora]
MIAIAKEAEVHFLRVDESVLTDKWYGESEKLTRVVFSVEKNAAMHHFHK